MTKRLAALLALLLWLLPAGTWAQAQQPVVTWPSNVATTNASGSVAVTNTFQSVFAAAGQVANPPTRTRQGCTIQNNGTHTMWVFVGPIANATENSSFQLIGQVPGVSPGGVFNCITGAGAALQDQISVTGTAGDIFAATSQ